MKRIRNLGLAVAMALALTATLGAGSASASQFNVVEKELEGFPSYPAYVNGETPWQKWEAFGGEENCYASQFSLAELAEPSSTLAATKLKNPNCWSEPFQHTAPFEFNGCSFVFHTGEETGPGVFGGTVDIGPAGCGPMSVKFNFYCNWLWYPGTGFKGVIFHNQGTGSGATVRAELGLEGIESKFDPQSACPNSEGPQGRYRANYWTLEAWNELGEQIGLRVE